MPRLKKRIERYIACEDLDFSWWPEQVQKVQELWCQGVDIVDISKQVHRDCDEVAILVMDLARQGKIQRRKRGVFGGEMICT